MAGANTAPVILLKEDKMTNQKAIETIVKKICCEKPIHNFCNDSCLDGPNRCPIDMAIQALKEQENKLNCLVANTENISEEDLSIITQRGWIK